MESLTSVAPALLFILKAVVFVFLALYIIFAVVIIRQVKIMTDTLEVGFETPIILLSYIHLAFSVCVLLLAIFIL